MIRKSSLFAALLAVVAMIGVGAMAHAQDAPKKAGGKKAGAKKGGRAAGKVSSVDAKAKSFVVTRKNKMTMSTVEVTVTTDDKTTFKKADGTAATFADVKVGEFARAAGKPDGENKVAASEVTIGRVPGAGKGKKAEKTGAATTPAPK